MKLSQLGGIIVIRRVRKRIKHAHWTWCVYERDRRTGIIHPSYYSLAWLPAVKMWEVEVKGCCGKKIGVHPELYMYSDFASAQKVIRQLIGF